MKKKIGWLAVLALLVLSYGRGNAHKAPGQEITVPVLGVDTRAACDDSKSNGNWTFAIAAVSGNVSKVIVQIYANGHTTFIDDELRLCADFPEPFGKEQILCFKPDPRNPEKFESAGSITIQNPQVGKQGALLLLAGNYCVRPYVTGNGSVTVVVSHP